MKRTLLILALLAPLIPFPASGQRGTVTVGADPVVYDAVAAGAAAWTATGYVEFAMVGGGCGAGDVTVCVAWWEPGWHLACHDCTSWDQIDVDGYDLALFGASEACHELGHYLGIAGHRSDGASCMTSPSSGVAYPDATDLAALGWAPPPPEPDKRVWGPLEPVLALPDTGAGTTAR
jgi:hypothetical protein